MSVGKKVAKALGLTTRFSFGGEVFDAEDVYKALDNALKVGGNGAAFFPEPYDGVSTHRAWLVALETKKNRTADELLEEVISLQDKHPEVVSPQVMDLIDEIKDYKRNKK